MIKARIANFPGMSPGNHNIDAIVITDYRGNARQILQGSRVDLEVSFETRKQNKLLVFLDNQPIQKQWHSEFVPEPRFTGRDLAWFLFGGGCVFLTLSLTAIWQSL